MHPCIALGGQLGRQGRELFGEFQEQLQPLTRLELGKLRPGDLIDPRANWSRTAPDDPFRGKFLARAELVRGPFRSARPRCCPIRSTSRRSSSPWESPAGTAARTRCGSTARRCGNRRSPATRRFEAGFAGVDFFQLLRRLEGAVVVDGSRPGDVGGTGNVAAAQGPFLRIVRSCATARR